jgi:hypothetical protein
VSLLVLNPDDIDRELKKVAANATLPAAQAWLMTVAKDHLMNLDGADRDENFVRYDSELLRPGRYEGMPDPSTLPASMIVDLCRGVKITVSDPAAIHSTPLVLPPWAEEALREGRQLWLFDSVPARTRSSNLWKELNGILNWFNSEPQPKINWGEFSFPEALRRANDWHREKGLD